MQSDGRNRTIAQLFSSFFRIGLFTFGGGYAMIPLIEREAVDRRGWIKREDILDILAISESTPGPLAINSATFVGYKVAGVVGSTLATLGVVLPSFIVICIISLVLEQFMANQCVAWAFQGIRSGVIVLMVNAVIKLGKACPRRVVSLALALAAFLLAAFTGLDIIVILVLAAITGIVYQALTARGKAGDGK